MTDSCCCGTARPAHRGGVSPDALRSALPDGAPRLILMGKPYRFGVQVTDQPLALRDGLVQVAVEHRTVTTDDRGARAGVDDDHLGSVRVPGSGDKANAG